MTDRITIPNGEVHGIMIAFREDISIGTLHKFCAEFNPEIEIDEDYGLLFTFNVDDETMDYFYQMYGCYATSFECDTDQKPNGIKPSLNQSRKETRTLPITKHGNSLTLNVTPMCKNLGVSQGDSVKTTLETINEPSTWGIFDAKGNLDCDPEPMIFRTRQEALEMLNSDAYESQSGYYVDKVI